MGRFAASLTDTQIKLARAIERAGLATFSQAVKAAERQDPRWNAWVAEIRRRQAETRQS